MQCECNRASAFFKLAINNPKIKFWKYYFHIIKVKKPYLEINLTKKKGGQNCIVQKKEIKDDLEK